MKKLIKGIMWSLRKIVLVMSVWSIAFMKGVAASMGKLPTISKEQHPKEISEDK